MKAVCAPLFLVWLAAFCGGGQNDPLPNLVHEGDLIKPRGGHYTFVRGNVIDGRDISIDYLHGDVRGKSKAVFINVMHGNIESGSVTVNVLKGTIIQGELVTVNVLLGGLDLSGRAKIGRKLPQ